MINRVAYQEEHVQEYEPSLPGWDKAESASDSLLSVPINNWEQTGVVRYPIWTVSSGELEAEYKKLVTKRPIQVEIRKGESLIFAESTTLNVFATGDTEEHALEDFFIQVIYQYEHYKKTPEDQFVGQALHLKSVFENLFREE